MKAVKINLAGRDRFLAMTVEAMFQIEEAFGGASELIDTLRKSGKEGFAAACKSAAILAEQGELARRSLGYSPGPMPTAEDIAASMTPVELLHLKTAISGAIFAGFSREVEPEDGDVDLGLVELNEQKKTT